jgi:hypothetical protein
MSRRNQAAAVVQAPAPAAPTIPPAPAVLADLLLETVKRDAENELRAASEVIERFKAKLDGDAAYAFSWSRDAFEAAAQQAVAREVLRYVAVMSDVQDEYVAPTSLRVLQVIRNELEVKVLQAARSPERSTSPQSNEMAATLNARRAAKLDQINNRLEYRNLPR